MFKSFFKNRKASFVFAIDGIIEVLKEETNLKIHFFATFIVLFLSFWLKISKFEWLVVVFTIGLVISLEMINSVVERISDFIHPKYNDKIKKIKDISAGAVLITALTALIIGIIIFSTRIFNLF